MPVQQEPETPTKLAFKLSLKIASKKSACASASSHTHGFIRGVQRKPLSLAVVQPDDQYRILIRFKHGTSSTQTDITDTS